MSLNSGQSPADKAPAEEARSVCLQGVWWPKEFVTEQSLNGFQNLEVRDDDVWVATYPKAGTHWVAEISHLVLHDGKLDEVDRSQQPMPMEFDTDPSGRAARYKTAPSLKSPRVLVTHVPKRLLPKQVLRGKGKVIVVIRNLKDTLVSNFYFLNQMFPDKKPLTFEESLQAHLFGDRVTFSPWFDHVAEYLTERHNKQYLFLKYEDIKADTRGAVVQVADFLGRPLSDEVIDKIVDLVTVKSMKTRYNVAGQGMASYMKEGKVGAPNLMRKGVVGDWKNTFTVAQSEAFDELYRQKMADLGLKLPF